MTPLLYLMLYLIFQYNFYTPSFLKKSNLSQWIITIPKSNSFVSLPLNNCLGDLTEIVSSLNSMLPQLTDFIAQFNNVVQQFNVNVISDSAGNMSIDVPADMSDELVNHVTKKLGIIDKLINSHGSSINELFEKGLKIENNLKKTDSNYSSVLLKKIDEFKQLNSSYKH